VAEAPDELAVITRVVEHGAERGHDRERTVRPESRDVPRIEDVRARAAAPSSSSRWTSVIKTS